MDCSQIRAVKNDDQTIMVALIKTIPTSGPARGCILDVSGFLKFGQIAHFNAKKFLESRDQASVFDIQITNEALTIFLNGHDLVASIR